MGVVAFALWVFCLVDVIGTPNAWCATCPKLAWLLLVLLFPLVGSILWLAAGRPEAEGRALVATSARQSAFPEYDRPGRAAAVDPSRTRSSCARCAPAPRSSAADYEQSRRPHPQQPAQPDPSAPGR